jgi:hypothetical protein
MTSIDRIKKGMFLISTVALVSGAWMSFSFGASMSFAHGITLALLTFVAAFMFVLIDHLKANGLATWKAGLLTGVACIFLAAEFFSHIGYTIGTRVENTEMTEVQNIKYDDSREMVADNKANLKMWKERLADLEKQNGWTATVSADALRAKLPGLELQIDQESKRGGCGPLCLKYTKERDDVKAQIATVEEVTGLKKQIEATQRKVDDYREKSAKVEYKSSPIVNQTKFVSQLATVSLEPGKAALTWTQIAIGFLIAAVTTFLAPYVNFLVFGDAVHSKTTLADKVSTSLQQAAQKSNTIIQRIDGAILTRDPLGNIVAKQVQALS